MKNDSEKAASYAREAMIAFCLSMVSIAGLPNILRVVDLPSVLDERGLVFGGILCGIWYGIMAGNSAYQAVNRFGLTPLFTRYSTNIVTRAPYRAVRL